MSGLVSRAPATHTCNPGWTTSGNGNMHPPMPHSAHPGDVWRCDCGQHWLASDARSNHATSGQRSIGAVDWQPITDRHVRRIQRKRART